MIAMIIISYDVLRIYLDDLHLMKVLYPVSC